MVAVTESTINILLYTYCMSNRKAADIVIAIVEMRNHSQFA